MIPDEVVLFRCLLFDFWSRACDDENQKEVEKLRSLILSQWEGIERRRNTNPEALKAEVSRLLNDSLHSSFIGRKLTPEDLTRAADTYKSQIERLGCTNVSVTPTDDYGALDVTFTPPPSPVTVTVTVSK